MKTHTVALALDAMVISYIVFSSHDELALDEACQTTGTLATLRAKIQGNSFWQEQLELLSRKIQWLHDEPERQAKISEQIALVNEKVRAIKSEHSSKRSATPSQEHAEVLTQEADKLDSRVRDLRYRATRIKIEEIRRDQLTRLEDCRASVEKKVATNSPLNIKQ